MNKRHQILILGASYGSLLATKLILAGHDVTLVCLPAEAELINRDGAVVRMPVRGREGDDGHRCVRPSAFVPSTALRACPRAAAAR